MSHHSIYGKTHHHIAKALELAQQHSLTGVLSQVSIASSKCACGFVFGHHAIADETMVRTATITQVGDGIITTESGARYLIADYQDDQARRSLERLRRELIDHEETLHQFSREPEQVASAAHSAIMAPQRVSIEFDGKLLQAQPAGHESLLDALERAVSSYAGESIRKCEIAPRGPAGERTYAVTFESGVTLNAHILLNAA